MKKTKQPGDNISLKTKKTEDPSVMQWINAQTNLMDSLRYLIEHEIVQHGIRNLQTFVPVERNVLGSAQREGEPVRADDGAAVDQPRGEPARWFDGGAADQRLREWPAQTAQQSSAAPGSPTARQGSTVMQNGQQSPTVRQDPTVQNGQLSPTVQQSPVETQAPHVVPGSRPEPSGESEPEPSTDDEIDEEDIDAWT